MCNLIQPNCHPSESNEVRLFEEWEALPLGSVVSKKRFRGSMAIFNVCPGAK